MRDILAVSCCSRLTTLISVSSCVSYFYAPTLITGSDAVKATDLRIWREEAFGPVLVLVPFDTEEEAITLANDSEYGLGTSTRFLFVKRKFREADQTRRN